MHRVRARSRYAFRAAIAIGGIVLLLAGCAASDGVITDAALGVPTSQPSSTTTTTMLPVVSVAAPTQLDTGVVEVGGDGAAFSETPGGEPVARIAAGIVMGFSRQVGSFFEVVNTCDATGWVSEDEVTVTHASAAAAPGPGFDVRRATIVLDPGHGGRDWGGVGESGLSEKAVNLDIAERVRTLMSGSTDVDWETSEITTGETIPAFGKVWLTRDRDAPDEGDIELGLGFRSALANAAGADVFVSIHNNTVPRIDTEIPGTEVYYSVSTTGSDRLASLIYEEVLRSFQSFEADWRGGELLGARARVDPDTGDDYYGILRRAAMPAAIVEGVYISEPEEEALLRTDEFRQAYAEGVYRGVVRFLTTDETGDAILEPEMFFDDSGTVDSSGCELAVQPE